MKFARSKFEVELSLLRKLQKDFRNKKLMRIDKVTEEPIRQHLIADNIFRIKGFKFPSILQHVLIQLNPREHL